MLEFKQVELSDKAWIDRLVAMENTPSADFNFGNIFMWDTSYRQKLARVGDRVIVLPGYAQPPFFAWPIGGGPLEPAFAKMRAYSEAYGGALTVRGVTKDHLVQLAELYPGQFAASEDRDFWDYLYAAEKLDILAGKHLHGKRNHINRFLAENDWSFCPLAAEGLPLCQALLDAWMSGCGEQEQDGIGDEYAAIQRGFAHYDALGLEGGMLFVGKRLVAFTIGEKISTDTFDVHFEKARFDVNGAYPMINQQFVRLIRQRHPEILWINREDDTGRESLRQSKLSYRPDRMVEKYTVVFEHE